MEKIKVDLSGIKAFCPENELREYVEKAENARKILMGRSGAGAEFTGWLSLPEEYDREEFSRILVAAEKIRSDSEVLIVIGIGGSYLGAMSAIQFLNPFRNSLPKEKRNGPEIYFAGSSLSGAYLENLLTVLGDRDFSINVISKSGTTTEPGVAFRIFKEKIEKKYGKSGAAKRIYATTDAEKGALKMMADSEGYETFVVPDDIGGRYSVLTAVGLLPIAVSGANIREMMRGADEMYRKCMEKSFGENPAVLYASYRNYFLDHGKNIEILASYDSAVKDLGGWWQQLYGESEGKNGKGLFPAVLSFTTDLHSVGQYIQDGQRTMIETVLWLSEDGSSVTVPAAEENLDNLNYLKDRKIQELNLAAFQGTRLAHFSGGTPGISITVSERSAEALGQLYYFFEFACGVSAYLLGVNPFDQPGVEDYKRNMFAILGKPGYEKETEEIREKI